MRICATALQCVSDARLPKHVDDFPSLESLAWHDLTSWNAPNTKVRPVMASGGKAADTVATGLALPSSDLL